MKLYKTVILTAVILAVGIAGFFIIREIVDRNTPSRTYQLSTVITNMNSNDVEEVRIDNNGIIMHMQKRSETTYDNDGNRRVEEAWYLVDEEDTRLAQRIVDGLVIAAANLTATEIIEEDVEDLSQYGLDGNYKVYIKSDKNVEYTLIIGDILYNREGYYAMIEGDDTVYSISLYSANNLYTTRAEILDLNIFQGSLNEVEAFSLYRDEDLRFTIETEQVITWVMTHPVTARADIDNADEMINNLLRLAVDEYVDVNPDDLTVYGLDKPRYSVSITIAEEEHTLLIGNEDIVSNTFYAMLKDKDEVFSVDASTLTFLDNDAIDMVYAIPYIPNITNVKSVDIEIEDMELLFELEYDKEYKMYNYKFNGEPINILLGTQTWGAFFYQQMISVPVSDLEPGWEISGEPYASMLYTYIDEATETIEYYPRDDDSCYFVRNGEYNGLVVDRSFLDRERGLAALVELVIQGKINPETLDGDDQGEE